VIADVEEALVAHWSQFGRWPRGELHDDDDGLLWFKTPIAHLPYNGVIRTHLTDGGTADRAIAAVSDRFRADGLEFIWFDHPSATPSDLGDRLAAHGLLAAEHITCMSLELAAWKPPPLPPGVDFREVCDAGDMQTYTDLTIRYWEIPDHEQHLVTELHGQWSGGRRYLALADGRAVAKGYLSLAGPPGVAAIFGMSVQPEARGRGIATGLTTTLLRAARDNGAERVVLHSTNMAAGVYRRAGFVQRCPLTIYATTPLWTRGHPHVRPGTTRRS
jgi:GNAT superfamily N-acetyltransferase